MIGGGWARHALAVLFLDLDDFKTVNDGSPKGRTALRLKHMECIDAFVTKRFLIDCLTAGVHLLEYLSTLERSS